MTSLRNKTTRGGFTLIELLVVISIIGLLSSMVLASVTKARNKALGISIYRNMLQVRNAVEMYRLTENNIPAGEDPNEVWLQDGEFEAFLSNSLIPTFISVIPRPPGYIGTLEELSPIYFVYQIPRTSTEIQPSCNGTTFVDSYGLLVCKSTGASATYADIFESIPMPIDIATNCKCIIAP